MLTGVLKGMGTGVRQASASATAIQPERTAQSQPATNEELMVRVQRGDMAAYQELVRLYQTRVFRVIRTIHRNPEDAMEVLQDTFLKLFTARRTWEKRSSFAAWLYRIAINTSIDRYRRGDRGRTTSIEEIMEGDLERSASGPRPADALDHISIVERRVILEEAVQRLPRRQREILSLRFFAEMQLEEIAAALSCPIGTVKSNLHKAVTTLRGLLMERREALGYE